MANYPLSLDSLSNPTGADKLNSASVTHSTQHATANDILEALEAKLGIGNTSPDAIYKTLVATGVGASAWGYQGLVELGTASGAAASYAFSSLNQGFDALVLVFSGRTDAAVTSATLALRINNDGGANYDYQRLLASGATATASEGLAQSLILAGTIPGASAGVAVPAPVLVWIPHYAATMQPSVVGLSGYKTNTSTGTLGVQIVQGAYRTSGAVTRLDLFPGSGSFTSDSRCRLFGIG